MQDQALQNLLKNGLSATGQASSGLSSMATQQASQDQQLQQAMASFLQAQGKNAASTQGAPAAGNNP
jgi:hypothetical protein